MAPPKQSRTNADRRARVEEMRREQKRRERRVRLLITGVGGVVAVAILLVIILTAVHNKSPVGEEVLPAAVDTTVAATTEPAAKVVKDDSGIAGVVAYDVSGHTQGQPTDDGSGLPFNHVDGQVTYSVTPPVGGDHNAVWMACGIYNAPVTTERAVHNLEHGAIWITYEPSLPAAELSQLKAFVTKQTMVQPSPDPSAERFMDLTPWKDNSIGSPIVMSSWGHQLKLTSATDPRMQKFVDTFRTNTKYTPELGSACSGEPVTLGGRPVQS